MEALNAEDGVWKEMPFEPKEAPPGANVKSVQGVVKGITFLVVEFYLPGDLDDPRYDGTVVIPPVTFARLPYNVSKAAFSKGTELLKKQKG